MKKCNYFLLAAILFFLISCSNSSENTNQEKTEKSVKNVPTKVELKQFTKKDVARFAIASIMGQKSKSIKVNEKDGLYYLSYTRKKDLEKFNYKVKINGSTVVWASIDGRWRDGSYDEKISFKELDNKLVITQKYSDGSYENYEYKLGD